MEMVNGMSQPIRYKWMVSDGDNKGFNSVGNVYGEMKVEKLGSVGHVQKSMGIC